MHQIIAITYNNYWKVIVSVVFVVSVGLIWDSESPDAEHIADVLQCIGTTLKLSDVRL